MTFLIILLIIICIWMIFGSRIQAWMHQQMINKMEDAVRRSMGMPSRKEEQRARRQAQKQHSASSNSGSYSSRGYAGYSGAGSGAYGHSSAYNLSIAMILQQYAEDVEFVEYREFSASMADHQATAFTVEEQVSDVKFKEYITRQ